MGCAFSAAFPGEKVRASGRRELDWGESEEVSVQEIADLGHPWKPAVSGDGVVISAIWLGFVSQVCLESEMVSW